VEIRKRSTIEKLHRVKYPLKDCRETCVDQFGLGRLLIENALTIPLDRPLDVSLTEFLWKTACGHQLPCQCAIESAHRHILTDVSRGHGFRQSAGSARRRCR
jgi:hypothetical protein